MNFGPNDILFEGIPAVFFTIFMIVFAVIIGTFIFAIKNAVVKYQKNASSPVLTARAKVVAKRTEVAGYHNMTTNVHMHGRTRTNYYTTFELTDGQRLELELKGEEFGLLVEGDEGELTYQGSWYKGFRRG